VLGMENRETGEDLHCAICEEGIAGLAVENPDVVGHGRGKRIRHWKERRKERWMEIVGIKVKGILQIT
jgi:hypothetical protein